MIISYNDLHYDAITDKPTEIPVSPQQIGYVMEIVSSIKRSLGSEVTSNFEVLTIRFYHSLVHGQSRTDFEFKAVMKADDGSKEKIIIENPDLESNGWRLGHVEMYQQRKLFQLKIEREFVGRTLNAVDQYCLMAKTRLDRLDRFRLRAAWVGQRVLGE